MKKKREEGTGATCNPIPSCNINAKVGKSANKTKDLERVFQYFRYTLGTSLDCANSTRILRNSITWYIAYLESQGILQEQGSGVEGGKTDNQIYEVLI